MTAAVVGLDAAAVADIAQRGSGSMPGIIGDAEEALLVAEFALSEWGG